MNKVVYCPEALLSDAVWKKKKKKKKKKWGEVLSKNKLTAHKHKLFLHMEDR
jgi:hypothetical protein